MRDLHVSAFAALVVMSLVVNPATAAGEPLAMPAETVSAIQAFTDATQQLNKAKAAMAALEAGEKAAGAPGDWAGVVGGYEAAAETIRRSSGPAAPDANAYGVPAEQLKSCGTRASALGKLDKQVKNIHYASQQTAETRALLKGRLDAAHAADETRRALVKAAAKQSGSPALGELFTWSWQDLEGPVAKAIAAYTTELKRYQDRMDRATADLRSRAATLSSQFDAFAAAKDCVVAGHWVGSKSQGGAVAGLTLHLVAAGPSWTGTANVDGKNVPVRSVALSGNTVSVSFADGKGSMKGTLSPDGRTYHGSFSSMDGPGSFSLQKQ